MDSRSWVDKQRLLWQNGKYVDLWTLVHIVMGALYASVFYLIGAPRDLIIYAGVGIAVFWEFWEAVREGRETFGNQVVDVVVFVLASVAVLYYAPSDPESLFVLVVILGALRLALRYLGYESYYWRKEKGLD